MCSVNTSACCRRSAARTMAACSVVRAAEPRRASQHLQTKQRPATTLRGHVRNYRDRHAANACCLRRRSKDSVREYAQRSATSRQRPPRSVPPRSQSRTIESYAYARTACASMLRWPLPTGQCAQAWHPPRSCRKRLLDTHQAPASAAPGPSLEADPRRQGVAPLMRQSRARLESRERACLLRRVAARSFLRAIVREGYSCF